jgi:glycosyltransferase involved in cell wall biosynthesis
LVIIEAASVGTPTVAYSVSGVRDAIVDHKTGLLTKTREPEALVDLLIKIYNDKKLYSQLSSACKTYSKSFDWSISIKESLLIIKKVIE